MSDTSADKGQQQPEVVFLSAHDTRGGTVNYIKALRQRFERDGYPCASIALYSGFDPDPSGVEEVITPRKNLPPAAYLATAAKFVAQMRQRRPAAIFTVMPMANVAAGIAGWFTGAAVIVTHHSPYDRNGRLARLLDRLVGALGAYREIICVSEAVAQSYFGHPAAYRRRLSVVPNGVMPVTVRSGRSQILDKFGLPDDMKLVYMAGRLEPQKNVLKAVEAVAQLEGVRLVLSGDGQLQPEIVALSAQLGITERVHLLGHVERQDMIDLMAICDAFMQISLFEGQSLSLLEAICAGAPPVVSNIPVQLEVIRMADGRDAGITCDPLDATDIARATSTLLFDGERRSAVLANVAALSPHIRTQDQMLRDYQRVLAGTIGQKDPTKSVEHAS